MKKIILPLILILLGNCNDKEVDFNPKAIVIVRMGDVRAGVEFFLYQMKSPTKT